MLTKVQKDLLVLLSDFLVFCQKYDIEFYMGGGCLVGAIRNEGFLPWDDDVDIHITRDNFDKLLSLEGEFPKGCIIVSREKYEDYPEIHPRYMNINRTASMRSLYLQSSPYGQFIDIFVLYPVPDEKKIQEIILKDYYEYLEISARHIVNSSLRDDELINKYVQSRLLSKDEFDCLCMTYRKKLYEYSEKECGSYLIRAPFAPHPIYDKKLWGTPKWVRFENISVPVPQRAEEVLMLAYGDRWVDIPNVEDRGSHLFINDQDIPCDVYDSEIKKYLDKKESLSILYAKKDYWFSILSDRNFLNSSLRYFHYHFVNYKIIRNIITNHVNLLKLAREKKFDAIRGVFRDYYTQQFVDAKYYNVFIPMDDQLLYFAMLPLIHSGDYPKVSKVLNLRINDNKYPLPTRLKKLKQLCDFCRDITNDIYTYFDYARARENVDKALKEYPELITLVRADIALDIKMQKYTQDTKKRLFHYLRMYAYDGELLKYLGDILLFEGKVDLAKRYYKKAYGFIKNGIVQMEITHELSGIY